MGIEFRAQLEQGLQADLHEDVVCREVEYSPHDLQTDRRQTKQRNVASPIGMPQSKFRSARQNLIDNKLERPWLEKIDTDGQERESQTEQRRSEEGPVIAEHASIDHEGKKLQRIDLRLNYRPDAEAKSEIPNLESENPACIT